MEKAKKQAVTDGTKRSLKWGIAACLPYVCPMFALFLFAGNSLSVWLFALCLFLSGGDALVQDVWEDFWPVP